MEDPFTFDSSLAVGLVEAALGTRPVFLTSLSERFYAASSLAARYCVVVEHDLYRVLPERSGDRTCRSPAASTP